MHFAKIYDTILLNGYSITVFFGGITVKKVLATALAAALVLASFTSCGEASADDEIFIPIRVGSTVNYDTAHAIIGTIIEQVKLDGSVTTPYTMDLSFTHMGGKIASMNIRQDLEVHEGDVIAVLDDEELEDEIVIQKINLDSAQSLYDTLVSQHASEEDIEFAKIDLEIEQAKYNTLIEKREFLTLKAPFDGRVTSVKNYRIGSHIDQNTPICTISDSSKVCLTVTDDKSILSDVSFGTRVDIDQGALVSTSGKVVDTITVDSMRGGWFNFGDDSEPSEYTSYVIQCDEDIEFSELGGISVTFTTLRRDDAVIVPTNSIFEETNSAGQTSYYVNVLMNGIKVQTPVTVGIRSGERAEILSGLDGTETLII